MGSGAVVGMTAVYRSSSIGIWQLRSSWVVVLPRIRVRMREWP
ncbi:hypothetical protein BH23PSE2_BH23PSE2_14490 [soil metagenome]